MISIKKVTKSFGGIKALDDCNLKIEPGKITALIGPNGSGKTTLFNIISNILKKDSGSVYLGKQKLSNKKDFEIARLGISRTFQETRFFRNLSIKEHLEIVLDENNEKLLRSLGDKENFDDEIKEILGLVGLDKSPKTIVSHLSYGQKKLLNLAVSIVKPHKVLILDEPVAGVNPKLRDQIKKILRNLINNGETILIIEHDMNFIMDLADYVFVLDEGKVIAEGKAKQVQKNKNVLEAYLGE